MILFPDIKNNSLKAKEWTKEFDPDDIVDSGGLTIKWPLNKF